MYAASYSSSNGRIVSYDMDTGQTDEIYNGGSRILDIGILKEGILFIDNGGLQVIGSSGSPPVTIDDHGVCSTPSSIHIQTGKGLILSLKKNKINVHKINKLELCSQNTT